MIKIGVAMIAGMMASATFAAPPPSVWLTSDIGDPYGAASIREGRYLAAEKRLTQAYARGDRSTELLLNLAALRARANSTTSHALYREVLQQPNISLITLSGTRWSHELAERGLTGGDGMR